MCFIQLAGNDLCHAKQEKVTTDILSNALKEGVGIKNVEIGQLLRRQPWASSASDNAERQQSAQGKGGKRHGIHLWTHRGYWTDLTYLGRDGVQIDAASRNMKKYLHSIRIGGLHHSS